MPTLPWDRVGPLLDTVPPEVRYLLPDDIVVQSESLAATHPQVRLSRLGFSREGRPILALKVGQGPRTVAVTANAHAEEAAGTVTCLRLLQALLEQPAGAFWLQEATFHCIPTANPDGLWRNRDWLEGTFDLARFLRFRTRDLPGEDVEFGYLSEADGAVRPENRAVAGYLGSLPGLDAYISLHSLDFAGGAWFLLQASDWTGQEPFLASVEEACAREGVPLHDEDRAGQKGFTRLRPGFHTSPTAEAMRAFFGAAGQDDLAQQFRLNSLQFVRQCHGTPLAVVSELPLAYAPELADMTPAEGTRSDVERRRQAVQAVALDDLAQTLNQLTPWADTPAAAGWLGYFTDLLRYRRASLVSQVQDLGRYAALRATHRDWASVALDRYRESLFLPAAALRLLSVARRPPADLRATYEAQFAQRFAHFTAAFAWHPLPLATQVRLQMALILGAANP
jgi:hypothetical protein